MVAKKGEIPAHVKKKEFSHPNTQHPVIHILEGVEDFRKPSQFFRFSLTSVLFMTIAAVICGAKNWPQIVVASQRMANWLIESLDLKNTIIAADALNTQKIEFLCPGLFQPRELWR